MRTWKPEGLVDDRLTLSVAISAVLFFVVGVGQLLADPTPGSSVASGVALATAVILAFTAVLLRRRPELITERTAPIAVAALAIVVAANPIAYIVATQIAYPAIGTLLVIVAIGALVPYPGLAVGLILALNVIAVTFAIAYPQSATVGSVVLQLVKADVVALIIALTWRRTEGRLRRANQTIVEIAISDELTGLLNRRGLAERAPLMLQSADSTGRTLLFGFIDVEGLKKINDSRGHAAGDQLLADIGHVLRPLLDAGDIAARVGGDEFAVVVSVDDRASIPGVRERVGRALAGHPTTVGWAVREPDSPASLESLLDESDRAMMRVRLSR